MPRLLLLASFACAGEQAPPAPRRVDAVVAAPHDDGRAIERFCDVRPPADAAPVYAHPPLDAPSPPAPDGPRWINVWATWCGPCVAELPMLHRWQGELADQGLTTRFELLSFDEDGDALARFTKKHPELRVEGSLRIAGREAIAPWLATLGLPPTTSIPLHVFVGDDGRVRCLRTSALAEHDRDVVARLLAP